MTTITIRNAKDMSMPWIHCFLYGKLGSGKTTAASTFPLPYFVVPENENSITTLMGDDVPYTTVAGPKKIGDVDGLEDVVTWMEEHHERYRAAVKSGKSPDAAREELPCDTLIVESLSHYVDLLIDHITKSGRFNMDQQKWGEVRTHFRTLQSRLRRIPIHVVWTSLAEETRGQNGQSTGGNPLISGATKTMLPSACDIVGYCTQRAGKPPIYKVHFREQNGFDARTRFKRMPDEVQDFAFDKIAQYLR